MRTIKFRVWDNDGYMSNPFTLQDLQKRKIHYTSDCVVMQFTGLLDKNGREIYEGDIVVCGSKREKVIVTFEQGCFYTKLNGSNYRLFGWINKVEIIGNIHENPELLKL